MSKYFLIKKLIENGELKSLIDSGIVAEKQERKFKIYEYYLSLKSGHHDNRTVVTIVSEDKNVCETTVYNIIREFSSTRQ